MQQARKNLTKKGLIVKLVAPIRIRKKATGLILKGLKLRKSPKLLFILKTKKCFNGCQAKKQRKKKRKGLRVFK